VFIADYVLIGYGTGAIMAVPGHDSATGVRHRVRPAHRGAVPQGENRGGTPATVCW
jgi:leucyl-tRNA synthetase